MVKKINYKIKIRENDVKKVVKDYLNATGWFNFHILQGMGAYKGIPDRIAIKGGRVLFLEIKTSKGKQSDYQKVFQLGIETAGGEYYIIRDIRELMRIAQTTKLK